MTLNNISSSSDRITATPLSQNSTSPLNTDILWRNTSTGSNAVWLMNGTTHEAGANIYNPGESWQLAATEDFNNDGHDDLFWRNSLTGENAIWLMENSSTILQGVWLPTVADQNWQVQVTADFNGNGSIDLFWRNNQTGENAIWFSNSNNLAQDQWVYEFSYQVPDPNWQVQATADFNSDGKSDLLWRNSQTGENAIWLMNGEKITSSQWLYKLEDSNWEIKATADFNSDGQDDIFWRNSQTGQNAIWQMSGTTINEGIWLDSLDTNWEFAGAVDLDGNNRADLFWRNSFTGQNFIWAPDGTNPGEIGSLNKVTLTAMTDPNWQIADFISRQTTEANNSLNSASDLGQINGLETITNYVGNNDSSDFYRFTIDSADTLRLDLSGLNANVDIELLDSNGTSIESSTLTGTDNESIRTQLVAGTYYAHIYTQANPGSRYTLNISSGLGSFNSTYGYGFVRADVAVAKAMGNDITLNQTSNWNNYTGGNWGNDAIEAPQVWQQGYTGKNIIVAVIDDGIDITHTDLDGNIWRNSQEIAGNGIDDYGNGYTDDINGWNFSLNNNDISSKGDHGTHVAGIIAGENNGNGVTGVAYDSQLMAIRLADGQGNLNGNIIGAIYYAVDNGARVINISLGTSESESASIVEALAYAASRNVLVVMAAGNEYEDDPDTASKPGAPANLATNYGISVGAVDISGDITSFSNRAGSDRDMLHVVAPGENIKSTTSNNQYKFDNGTSFAAPHIAGIVAMMLQANPHLSHAQVRQIIAESGMNP